MYPFRKANVSASSPISSLPVELLSEIFSLCVLSADDQERKTDGSEYSPPAITSESIRIPLVLSSVNRRWREVALNQSSLWSNICVTAELLDDLFDHRGSGYSKSAKLNPTHITTYLTRSRHHPIHILIDGRDPDWDFSEPDVGIDFGTNNFSTLFSSPHMSDAISLLLPHIARWKSFTILTDTWEPMYTALSLINPSITQYGAPQLQALSLMRCNDYVSFSRRFQPRHLRDLGFLTPYTTKSRKNLLPRLKHLSLRGVHVDWDSLSDLLLDSSLSTLELASHPKDVRPSMSQFRKLLSSTPSLRSLSVIGTGPEGPGSEEDSAHNYESIHLPHLNKVTMGYRTETGARSLFHFLDAPNATSLTLEDTSYPADPSDVNAGPILNYLGTKQCDGNDHALDTTQQPPEAGEKRRKRSICEYHSESSTPKSSPSVFPRLQEVTLRNIKSTFHPLASFIRSLSNVTHLELVNTSMLAVQALVPYATPAAISCPCPKLSSLFIKDSELRAQDLDFIVCKLSHSRQSMGARELDQLDIHVDASRVADAHLIAAAAAASPDSKVNIISDSESESDSSDDDTSFFDEEDEEAAYRPGGVFNDPEFDAYWSMGIAAH